MIFRFKERNLTQSESDRLLSHEIITDHERIGHMDPVFDCDVNVIQGLASICGQILIGNVLDTPVENLTGERLGKIALETTEIMCDLFSICEYYSFWGYHTIHFPIVSNF